ncbi:MAG: hypothetical protein COW88_01560 [Candidatus Lloydbacteria bacterium CG22_combo_CG10-13_8_21_14_all_47_15]|uniref:POTRA domain-containing protein n=1 Tax=Candidatus Lloydbacteria bacterium CG22_combo_CG10-13_8_21_14_all_47_15 TaxID=1974635 RepID=A0A2H0CUH2_9BACT|nr:MAG: hypothetical protein COW88_01560 [Candidatus Lloydbacteria bacterium CG22_combo_CG10-13_8_21_14_all_47_15]
MHRRSRGKRGFFLRRIERNRNEVIFWGVTFVAACGALLVATAAVSREPSFAIRSVEVRGAEVVPAESIEAAVREAFGGSYAGIIEKGNRIFYPRQGVIAAARSVSERIAFAAVSVEKHVLEISVSERAPRGRWCGRAVQAGGADEPPCYLFDASGYLFAEAGSEAPSPKIFGPLVNDERALIGGSIAPRVLAVLNGLEERLLFAGIPLASLLALPEDDFLLVTESGVKILFTGKIKLEAFLASLYAALKTDNLKERLDAGMIEYIDFRFDDKVFYK